MAKATTQPQAAASSTVKTLTISKDLTSDKIVKELDGRALGNPIYGHEIGDEFTVTLNGKIEIREFNKVKGAYFLTKEGYSIRVNASYDPSVHTNGSVFWAACREMPAQGDQPARKFTVFVNKK
jgi:hypothetical protein